MADPRDDIAAFAERVLRQPLWTHQVEAAEATAWITSIAKARRTGGTVLMEALAIWTAIRDQEAASIEDRDGPPS